MSSRSLQRSGRAVTEPETGPEGGTVELSTVEVLDLLDDEYSRRVLEATVEEAKPARELVEELDASRATVYRRLDRLTDAGLVEVTMEYDADGHHRQAFRATLDAVTVSLGDGSLATTVEVRDETGLADR